MFLCLPGKGKGGSLSPEACWGNSCKDWQVGHRGRLQASSYNSEGIVDGHVHLLACGLLLQTGAQYSAVEKTRAWVDSRNVLAEAPQVVPARRRINATLDVTFALTSSRCCLKDSVRSRRTPRYFGACWTSRRLLSTHTSSSLLASLVLRWYAAATVFPMLSCRRHLRRYATRVPMSSFRPSSIAFHVGRSSMMARSSA